MLHFPRWQVIAIVGICLLSLLIPVPSFLSQAAYERLPNWLHYRFGLGLDLRGGAHLLAEMDLRELRRDWLESLREEANKRLREAKPDRIPGRAVVTGNVVQVRLANAGTQEAAVRALRPMITQIGNPIAGTTQPDLEIRAVGTDTVDVTPTEVAINDRATAAISTAIEVIRKRLDPDGTKEVAVQRQGRDRILVQQPGVETEAELNEIKRKLGTAAKMTFHLVHRTMSAEQAKISGIPADHIVVPSQEDGGSELIERRALLTGENLSRASAAFDSQNNQPIVSFVFKPSAARQFGDITTKNKGYRFAVVLDNQVITAPVIQSEILGGVGQISGRFTVEDTTRLATLLNSGALPAKLTVVEERVVGASLGQDSIDAGKWAAYIGIVAVAIYMIAGYGVFGAFAVIGASFHVVMILALMSLLGSTMTLPGIAGIVLTIGMAVDANVLIYERTREELRAGKTPIAALDAGFRLAYATIIDSQMTSFIAGVLMFALGSGPIRGFAVTFTLGVVTTVFSAVTITRLLAVWWLKSYGRKAVPAPL